MDYREFYECQEENCKGGLAGIGKETKCMDCGKRALKEGHSKKQNESCANDCPCEGFVGGCYSCSFGKELKEGCK